ncbi:MAG: AAA family ATPase [Nitrospirae bacterium]|nr:MAG: AAA family ATPase [Nitrospirota bacterium]
MYEEYFGLNTKPFELVPNPDFLYPSRAHKKALIYLDYGIQEGVGFILLTGEVGSGKTTIIRNILKKLKGKYKVAKVFNTKVSSEQLFAMINDDFGLEPEGKDKITLIRELNEFLIDQYANNHQTILIIDEAQNLSDELLEEIRMLSNLETDTQKLLQIILVGQPELRKTLAKPELRQLRQRISISCHIQPLTKEETEEYILHRLEVAGNRDAVTFEEGVFDFIHNYSRGIPRLINIICDFLLLSAFVEETKTISKKMTAEVIGELDIENQYWTDKASQESTLSSSAHSDIEKRLSKLENQLNHISFTEDDRVEIMERISGIEKVVNRVLLNSKNEVPELNKKLFQLQVELKSLEKTVSEIKSKLYDKNAPNSSKNTIWGLIKNR